MFKLILRQANWGIFGAIFAFIIGFFVKIFIVDIVGLENWGKYVTAQIFSSISETILSVGIPYIILKFFPNLIEKDRCKSSRIANVFLRYSFIIGLLYLIIIYFSSSYINTILYGGIDNLDYILFLMCIHVPISMLFGVVVSLYRSVLKIKEIVVYGTCISVTLRALLTFIIFQYTSNITWFIFIELFAQVLSLTILLFLFNKNEFTLFKKSHYSEVLYDTNIVSYGKKMYLNSIIAFISAQALTIIISVKLNTFEVGAYNIILSFTTITTFLLINLNKVFAPAISKLYKENNFKKLDLLYKKTTIFINLFTLPLVISVLFFSEELLKLYSNEMLDYNVFLYYMLIGGIISSSFGSSGTMMIMAGLEKENLYIQFIRGCLIIILSLFLLPVFGMYGVVFLYIIFMLLVNLSQYYLIKKNMQVTPFSPSLFILYLIAIFGIYLSINFKFDFKVYHFFIIPIFIYIVFFILMFKSFKKIIKELLQ